MDAPRQRRVPAPVDNAGSQASRPPCTKVLSAGLALQGHSPVLDTATRRRPLGDRQELRYSTEPACSLFSCFSSKVVCHGVTPRPPPPSPSTTPRPRFITGPQEPAAWHSSHRPDLGGMRAGDVHHKPIGEQPKPTPPTPRRAEALAWARLGQRAAGGGSCRTAGNRPTALPGARLRLLLPCQTGSR